MKPSAMLVGAFEIKVRHAVARTVGPVPKHECMRRARVEPNIQNIEYLLVLLRVVVFAKESSLCARQVPSVGAFLFEYVDDPLVDSRVSEQKIWVAGFGVLLDKACERNAPRPLPGKHPVRPVRDHGMQTVSPCRRSPFDMLIYGGQGALADRLAEVIHPVLDVLVYRHEPLLRIAEYQWSFGPPAMRIGMRQIGARGQHSAFEQFLDDSRIGLSLFASLREDIHASE